MTKIAYALTTAHAVNRRHKKASKNLKHVQAASASAHVDQAVIVVLTAHVVLIVILDVSVAKADANVQITALVDRFVSVALNFYLMEHATAVMGADVDQIANVLVNANVVPKIRK